MIVIVAVAIAVAVAVDVHVVAVAVVGEGREPQAIMQGCEACSCSALAKHCFYLCPC